MSRWSDALNPARIMIMFLIIGPGLLIVGGIQFFVTHQTTSKCTSVAYGVVVDVETIIKTDHYGTMSTGYIATVVPSDSDTFGSSALRSEETGHMYENGRHVGIYYDPSDPSNYYIEFADPAKGNLVVLGTGAIVLMIGIVILLVRKLPSR